MRRRYVRQMCVQDVPRVKRKHTCGRKKEKECRSRRWATLTLKPEPQADSRGPLIYCPVPSSSSARASSAPSGKNGVTSLASSGVTTVLRGASFLDVFSTLSRRPKRLGRRRSTVLRMGRDESRKTPRHPQSRDDFSYLHARPQSARRARGRRTCGHRARI